MINLFFNSRCSSNRIIGLVLLFIPFTVLSGEYRGGVENVAYQPYYSSESESGTYSGYVRDILDAFAESEGIKFNYMPLPIKRLHNSYLGGHLDFIYPDNPDWIVKKKKGTSVKYSLPVVRVIDGVMVKPNGAGNDISSLKRLGTISGYTVPAYQKLIDTGELKLIEINNFDSLLEMVMVDRVDAAYVSINPAFYKLRYELEKPKELIFNKNLPYDQAEHHLSTIKHESLLNKFSVFLKQNQLLRDEFKLKYGIIDLFNTRKVVIPDNK